PGATYKPGVAPADRHRLGQFAEETRVANRLRATPLAKAVDLINHSASALLTTGAGAARRFSSLLVPGFDECLDVIVLFDQCHCPGFSRFDFLWPAPAFGLVACRCAIRVSIPRIRRDSAKAVARLEKRTDSPRHTKRLGISFAQSGADQVRNFDSCKFAFNFGACVTGVEVVIET